MPFCALIPCGPLPIEIERLDDLINSIYHYEPACKQVYILNDGNTRLDELHSKRYKLLSNPRRGQGWGVGGGLVIGQLHAYRTIYEQYPELSYILRLDTDAHIIGAFDSALKGCFEDYNIGMAGSRIASNALPLYKKTPPLSYFAKKVKKLQAPLSLWRQPAIHVRCTAYGVHRRVAEMFSAAESKGYTCGELIEGGSFAVSRAWLENLAKADLPAGVFLDIPVTEDVVMTMLSYYLNKRAVDVDCFCIEPGTLRWSPDRFGEHSPAAIIHSIKRFGDMDEQAIRSYFRGVRQRESEDRLIQVSGKNECS
jgi:hypothetical protein